MYAWSARKEIKGKWWKDFMIISIPFSDLSNFMFPVYQKKDEVLVKISQRCSGSSFHWVSDQLVFKKTTIKSLKLNVMIITVNICWRVPKQWQCLLFEEQNFFTSHDDHGFSKQTIFTAYIHKEILNKPRNITIRFENKHVSLLYFICWDNFFFFYICTHIC